MVSIQNIILELNAQLKELTQLEKLAAAKIQNSNEGKLYTNINHNRHQYYFTKNGDKKKIFIRKENIKLAKNLAEHEYYSKLYIELKKSILVITKFLKNYHPEKISAVYSKMPAGKKVLFNPEILPDDEFARKWESASFKHKPFSIDSPEFYTLRHEKVRSKAEVIIGDRLFSLGIPYIYEFEIKINGLGIIHPDFLCLNKRTRQEFIWEHLGMMDNSQYADAAINRINKLQTAGYYLGENLIITMESTNSPLDTAIIENLIKKYLE